MVTPSGWRTEFLTQLGFGIPDDVGQYVDGDQALVPRDRMVPCSNSADVLIWTTESDEDTGRAARRPDVRAAEGHEEQPQRAHRQGTRRRHRVRSVLSYPVVADQLPPMLARALA